MMENLHLSKSPIFPDLCRRKVVIQTCLRERAVVLGVPLIVRNKIPPYGYAADLLCDKPIQPLHNIFGSPAIHVGGGNHAYPHM